MTSRALIATFVVACCLGSAAGLTHRIALARSHRDVAAMAVGSVALLVILGVALSMVLMPDSWATAYDGAMSFVGQR